MTAAPGTPRQPDLAASEAWPDCALAARTELRAENLVGFSTFKTLLVRGRTSKSLLFA